MRRHINWMPFFAALISSILSLDVSAATVNFQGTLYNMNGTPVPSGRVIAGTFKPGFDVSFTNYSCTYGDFACNLDPDNYAQAVADGNFIPLNSGVLTNAFGVFSGSGTSTATGSKIYIYGFTGSQPVNQDLTQVLATSSDASYVVPASGSTTVNASAANQFIYGAHFSNGFQTTVTPFPEPGTFGLCLLAAGGAATIRLRRRSLAC